MEVRFRITPILVMKVNFLAVCGFLSPAKCYNHSLETVHVCHRKLHWVGCLLFRISTVPLTLYTVNHVRCHFLTSDVFH